MSRVEKGESANPAGQKTSNLQAHSCMLCKRRKVKCDKRYPCSPCTRAKVQCVFRAPVPPRRGKHKPTEVNLLARLKRYEDMLQALGVPIEPTEPDADQEKNSPGEPTLKPDEHTVHGPLKGGKEWPPGKLVAGEKGKGIYFENMLWKSLSDEIRDPDEILQASSDDETAQDEGLSVPPIDYARSDLLFNPGRLSNDIRIQHPTPAQALRLWEAYCAAVNPLCNLLHKPTTYTALVDAIKDVSHLPRNFEALLFSIYAISALTLEEDECQSLFGEKRDAVVERYMVATKLAFHRAGILRSADVMLVQAMALHLFLIRTKVDASILWIYTGIGVRLAQRIGLHRDGSKLNLSVFESEMRRRLWWQIIVLDTHAAQICGAGPTMSSDNWDVELPANINDDQLWPEMTEKPIEQEGATEMFFSMIRFEFGRVFRQPASSDKADLMRDNVTRMWSIGPNSLNLTIEEKDRRIDEAERRIGEKYLRHVEAFDDVHMLSLGVARIALASMRLMVHHPRQYPDKGASMPAEEKENVFQNALRILEYDRNSSASPNLRKFRWHFAAFFHTNALVLVLLELCHLTQEPKATTVWRLVGECYRLHPEIITDQKRAVHVALGNLTLRAWRAREKAWTGPGILSQPEFIDTLLARSARAASRASGSTGHTPMAKDQTSSQPLAEAQNSLPGAVQARKGHEQLQQGVQALDLAAQHQHQYQQSLPSSVTAASFAPTQPIIGGQYSFYPSNPLLPSSLAPPLSVSGGTTTGMMLDRMTSDAGSSTSPFVGAMPAAGAMNADAWLESEPMDWAAWDDLIADSRREGYGIEGAMAPLGFGWGG